MLVVHGTRFYGKVDRVPGLCYVRTRFYHVQFVPLIPLESFVLVEGTNEERGQKIPLSIKSVLTAWVRTALVLLAAGYGIATAVHGVRLLAGEAASRGALLACAGWMAGACLVYWMTVRFSRAGYSRAIKLGGYLGVEPAVVEQFLYGASSSGELCSTSEFGGDLASAAADGGLPTPSGAREGVAPAGEAGAARASGNAAPRHEAFDDKAENDDRPAAEPPGAAASRQASDAAPLPNSPRAPGKWDHRAP